MRLAVRAQWDPKASLSRRPTPAAAATAQPSTANPPAGEADVQVLVHVLKPLSAQFGSRKQDRDRHRSQPFGVCVGILLKSADVALLLRPVPQGDASPLGSDLSPSESGGTLVTGGDGAQPTAPTSAGEPESRVTPGFAPACPSPSLLDGHGEASLEKSDGEDSLGLGAGLTSSSEEKADVGEMSMDPIVGVDGVQAEQGGSSDSKTQQKEAPRGKAVPLDPLTDPLTKDSIDSKDKPSSVKMPQSMSSGRLLKDRSQSSFSVSYKNLKKSPSLHSLDNISIDSYLIEDCDTFSLQERDGVGDDLSISGLKDAQSDQSGAESANEALGLITDGGASPDTVSATSQSIDEPAKDLVSVLVLKVHSVCGSLEMHGDSTAVSLEVGQVVPAQLGNVSLRQYLSNRSLGSAPGVTAVEEKSCPEVQVRLESGSRAAVRSPLAAQSGFLRCHLQGFHSDFLMSSLRNLGHFVQDDSASHILPMQIDIRDMHINLKDDAPRDNPSDPEPTPIALNIDNLVIYRKDDGSFSIGVTQPPADGPGSQVGRSGANSDPGVAGAVSHTSRATQTTPLPLTSNTLSPKEELLMEENECLKVELSRAKMALAEAQMEKDSLMHRMKSLKLTPGGSN
ncbi:hypothetical protein GJAV_G00158860 [Gymnothorax javanicus]|nr:hypothetical protein GJAV_G00158860 [Gymnothorax javanicus]